MLSADPNDESSRDLSARPILSFGLLPSRSDIIRWWTWLSFVLYFRMLFDISLGTDVFFPFVSSSAPPLPRTPSWLHPCSYLSLHVCDVLYHFPDNFSDLLLEKILNFSLCSFVFAASRSLYPPQFGVSSLRYKPSDILWSVRKYNVALFFLHIEPSCIFLIDSLRLK